MGFWSRLCYEFGDKNKVINIRVEFSLITKSGYDLYLIEKNIKPKKLYVCERYDSDIWDTLRKDYGKLLNEIASDLLIKNRKKKEIKLGCGKAITGKHIVKCTWDIYTTTERLTYEEYLKLKK